MKLDRGVGATKGDKVSGLGATMVKGNTVLGFDVAPTATNRPTFAFGAGL